jgi:putative ABC transport system permease protein
MNLGALIRSSLSEIRHHKLRSTLTLLGIILGTLSITVMTTFLDGIVGVVWEGISDLGYDGVMYVVGREPRDLREQAIFARSRGLQPEDSRILLSRAKVLSAVAPVMYHEEIVRARDEERKARVMGVTPSYAYVRGRSMEAGRFINDFDERTFARVCVLGHRLNKRLFGTEDSLGKMVTLGSRQFRVVGVAERLGTEFVNDSEFAEEMEGVYIPLITLRKFYAGDRAPLAFLAVKTDDEDKLGDLKAEAIASLKIAHRGAQDFEVQNIAEEMLRVRQEVTEVLANWRIVLGSIAGISLLVGGIGLLSVMLISIGERLYEIGLRKAIGATDFAVFMQFLLEAVALSLIGALIGAGGGVAVARALSGFFVSGLPVNLPGLILAIGLAILLGIVFGIYPALKASRLEPVDALRSAA